MAGEVSSNSSCELAWRAANKRIRVFADELSEQLDATIILRTPHTRGDTLATPLASPFCRKER